MAEFDIKTIITTITEKLKAEPAQIAEFFKDPVKKIEALTGIDLPDEKVKEVVSTIKSKVTGGELKLPEGISLDSVKGLLDKAEGAVESEAGEAKQAAEGVLGKIKGIFGK